MKESDIKHLEWIYGRMSDVHGENTNVDYMSRFKKIIDTARASVIIGKQPADIWKSKEAEENFYINLEEARKKDMENKWIDLDIREIPSDFFVNENYELECYEDEERELKSQNLEFKKQYDLNGDWVPCDKEINYRVQIISFLVFDDPIKFRYRLKPIESIRITKEIADKLFRLDWQTSSELFFNNRPVEIID